jgi:5'-3' exonuclease
MAKLDDAYWAAAARDQRSRSRGKNAAGEERDAEAAFPPPDDRHRAIRPGTPCWRLRYYTQLFGITDPSEIKDVALEYAVGLQWTADYYAGALAHPWPFWHYPHAYGPTVADLRNAVQLHRHEITAMARARARVALAPWQHLAAVMPIWNADLVPPEGRAYMRDPGLGMTHQYPAAARRATYLRHRGWECAPLLPPMRVPGVAVTRAP